MWGWRARLPTQDQVTCHYSSIHPSCHFFFFFFYFLFCFSFCTRAFAKSSSVAITSQYSRMSQKRVERPRTAEPVGPAERGKRGNKPGKVMGGGGEFSVTWPTLTVVLPNGTTIVCSSHPAHTDTRTYTLLCVSYLVFAFHALCVRPCIPCCPSFLTHFPRAAPLSPGLALAWLATIKWAPARFPEWPRMCRHPLVWSEGP